MTNALAFVALAVLGCSRGGGAAVRDSGRPGTMPGGGDSVAVRVTTPSSLPGISPHATPWDTKTVAERVRALGFGLTAGFESVNEPFLKAPGARLIVHARPDSAEILVFIYGDALAAGRDLEALDTTSVSPRTARVAWRAPARLVTDNNLVAIVLSENDALRARLVDALRNHQSR